MKRAFVGHRGSGKTSLLKRHQSYFPTVKHIDLDQQIELDFGRSVSDIFLLEGEKKFRDYELQVFKKIIDTENDFVISLGGGFNPLHIPAEIEVVYISRRTDSDGRIFLNRPKLISAKPDLEEYQELYERREMRFRERADFVYHLPEGLDQVDPIEEKIFKSSEIKLDNVYLTLQKKSVFELKCSHLELRDDVLSSSEIENIIQKYNDKKFIISHRDKSKKFDWISKNNVLLDWALECGEPPQGFQGIISIHEGPFNQALEKVSHHSNQKMKFCPIVEDWKDLEIGYCWQQEQPQLRSFLPRTPSSEKKSLWRWFRLKISEQQEINFAQGILSLEDQPSLYEFLNWDRQSPWGAVLGFPVHQSRTPIEQAGQGWNISAVPINESNYDQAIAFLQKLKLQVAAVTSPLKNKAGGNTLVFLKDQIIKTSTDSKGFEMLFSAVKNKDSKIAVWGGDGVLNALEDAHPHLVFYSARNGEIKNNKDSINPDIIVWAAPRRKGVNLPKKFFPDWNPEIILDLNYTDNSMGIDCAKDFNCRYISGLAMFKEQAFHQRKFWKDHL